MNDLELDGTEDELVDLTLGVASSKITTSEVAVFLGAHVKPTRSSDQCSGDRSVIVLRWTTTSPDADVGRTEVWQPGVVREVVPQDKSDTARAHAAVAAGFPAVEPVLGELLIWLQDMNWPVAKVLAPFLATIGRPLTPHVRVVLHGEDEVWKYWILTQLLAASHPLATELRGEVERIALRPTDHERAEEVDDVAAEVLRAWGWA